MNIIDEIKRVIDIEISALKKVYSEIDDTFINAINILSTTSGKVILCGIGKSGLIAKKIAATMSSTGTSSFFVHASEALHGDLGMISENDSIIAISNSGESKELISMLNCVKKRNIKIIGISKSHNSSLAELSDCHIQVEVDREADEFNLAPSSSTTCVLAIGDAIAITLSKMKSFSPKDFAKFHPGGSLGDLLHGK